MKSKRAFTLVELLTVIAILGIISLIVVPTIDKSIGTSKSQLYEAQEGQIIKGAKDYYAMNTSELPEDSEGKDIKEITIKKLQDEGFLQLNIKDPEADDYISPSTKIRVTSKGDGYKYEVIKVSSEERTTPEIILNGGPIQYVELGREFVDAGYKAVAISGANITDEVTTIISDKMNNQVSELSTSSITTYTIRYYVTDPNNPEVSAEAVRTVMVVDTTKPTINLLKGDYIELTAMQVPGFDYNSIVSATDNNGDAKITYVSNLSQLEGAYSITYKAVDASGNVATKRVTVNVIGGIKITVENANVYTSEKSVHIDFPEYQDKNYMNQYSLDGGETWITTENSSEEIVLNKTTFLIVRLYDGANVGLSTTYTITNFDNE